MLTSTGDIEQSYRTIGVVHASIGRLPEGGGCMKRPAISVEAAYREATLALEEAAALSGGNAVIHIGYDHRMASRTVGCNEVKPAFEVYAWGAAGKARNEPVQA